jgi:2-keto-4-pentenoate hydratase
MQPFVQSVLAAIESNIPVRRGNVEPPHTPAEVERAQVVAIESLGGIGAWKVSPWTEKGSMWAGPIPRTWIRQSSETIEFGRYRIEVEFALVRTADGGYELAPAIELLQSRLDPADEWPALAKEADLFSTAGLVIGTPLSMPSNALSVRKITLNNGNEPQTVSTELSIPALLNAASWVEAHASRLGLPIEAGMIILTGARIGPVPQKDSYLRAEISDLGSVEIGSRH